MCPGSLARKIPPIAAALGLIFAIEKFAASVRELQALRFRFLRHNRRR